MPREYTEEEVRELFLKRVWILIDYWDKEKENKREALEGLTFSILAELDGESSELPPFMIIPMSNEDDRKWYIEREKNWFPKYHFDLEEICDIGGSLHELFHTVGRMPR